MQLKTKELFRFPSGCHGSSVTIAMRYMADAYHAKEPSYQVRTHYKVKQNDLLSFTLVAMGTRYMADVSCLKEPPYLK